jgi:hypothetical protein
MRLIVAVKNGPAGVSPYMVIEDVQRWFEDSRALVVEAQADKSTKWRIRLDNILWYRSEQA